jgi:hypothetical protein
MKLLIFLFFYLLQILIAYPHFSTCKNINLATTLIFLLHHVIDVYGFFGIFINESLVEYIIHFCMIILVMTHWYFNNYYCEVTRKLNELCERDQDEWEFNIVGKLVDFTGIFYLHTYLLSGILIYDFYKIISLS